MITRRAFLQAAALGTGGLLTGCATMELQPTSQPVAAGQWTMPDEGAPHSRTWMAFGASEGIWGRDLLPEVRRNLATIARTIARFEPVTMLVRQAEYALAQELVGPEVELLVWPLDDLWMRDTGAIFVTGRDGKAAAIDFNFNGWGEKQEYSLDAKVAAFVAQQAGAPLVNTSLVLEGGCIEVDGAGTAIITESCVLNQNRNPGLSKSRCEELLMPLLGLDKIIWLPGIRGMDITDGHTDFYARFARPGVVVGGYDPDPASFDHAVTKSHLEILRAATDAWGRPLDVVLLEGPTKIRDKYASDDFAAGYVGFYLCNGGVILQGFGDARADAAARQTLADLFPEREVVQIDIDAIAAGGGSVHCATQQEPAVSL